MKNLLACLTLFASLHVHSTAQTLRSHPNQDYTQYHTQVIKAEKLVADKKYKEALVIYDQIFNSYDFVFLREYRVATQLAIAVDDYKNAIHYLKAGIDGGWTLKSIKKNDYLRKLRVGAEWKSIKKTYKSKRHAYEATLNQPVRMKVKKMFSQDQWKAIGALFTFSSKRQDRYAEKKFAPQSEKQITELISILNEFGYPGERFIGNNFWTTTILSHHNSISQAYVEQDTLYQFTKPMLLQAIKDGQMSPWEFALVDDWYRAVKSDRTEAGYGFLNSPTKSELASVNELRNQIGLRSVETRNGLIDIENLTGMNFYLGGRPWVEGKIFVKDKE